MLHYNKFSPCEMFVVNRSSAMALSKDFISEILTLAYNCQVFCVVEQPSGSKLFEYGNIRATCLQLRLSGVLCALVMAALVWYNLGLSGLL